MLLTTSENQSCIISESFYMTFKEGADLISDKLFERSGYMNITGKLQTHFLMNLQPMHDDTFVLTNEVCQSECIVGKSQYVWYELIRML